MKWIHGKYINNNINMFRCILEGQWDKGSNVMKTLWNQWNDFLKWKIMTENKMSLSNKWYNLEENYSLNKGRILVILTRVCTLLY